MRIDLNCFYFDGIKIFIMKKFKVNDSFPLSISGRVRVVTRNERGDWIADDGRVLGAYDGAGDPMNPVPVLYDGSKIYLVTDKVMELILRNQI